MIYDSADGLAYTNLLFFIRYMEQVHGIKTVTHPKEALETAQRTAIASREIREAGLHLRTVGGTVRTEVQGVQGWNPAARGRPLGALAPGPHESET